MERSFFSKTWGEGEDIEEEGEEDDPLDVGWVRWTMVVVIIYFSSKTFEILNNKKSQNKDNH